MFEFRFEISTALVVVGVAVELLAIAMEFLRNRREYREDLNSWKDAKTNPPHKPLLRHVLVEVIGAVFVVGGVAGEFWYQERISVVDSCVQQADNARAVLLKKQSNEAIELANKADLNRIALENRMLDIYGPRQLTPEQSARIAGKLEGLQDIKIDVYVMDIGDPRNSPEFKDSVNTGRAVLRILLAAHMDAEGWVLNSCQGATAQQLNVSVAWNGSDSDRNIARKVLDAFPRKLGIFSEVQNGSEVAYCKEFSDLDENRPNKRKPGTIISITIGKKITPLLTGEMLEPADEQKPPLK